MADRKSNVLSKRTPSRAPACTRRGLTLIELVVVIAILAVLIGFIIPVADYAIRDSKKKVTNADLVLVRDAIMGTQDKPGYLTDTGQLPTSISDLFARPASIPAWDRDSRTGWNGPYVVPAGNASGTTVLDGWGHPIIFQIPNQTALPTPATAAAANIAFARLISAGPDGIVETPQNAIDANSNPFPAVDLRGDDIVLFIKHSDSDP